MTTDINTEINTILQRCDSKGFFLPMHVLAGDLLAALAQFTHEGDLPMHVIARLLRECESVPIANSKGSILRSYDPFRDARTGKRVPAPKANDHLPPRPDTYTPAPLPRPPPAPIALRRARAPPHPTPPPPPPPTHPPIHPPTQQHHDANPVSLL